MRRMPIVVAAVLAIGALWSALLLQVVQSRAERHGDPNWQEVAWPFPRDGWRAGRAFRCHDASCNGVELYVRPKIGFCNCDTGVADDDEVDRVADLDMISPHFRPQAPGKVIRIVDLSGRSRNYDLDMADGSKHAAVGFAVSHHCDLLVAVAQGDIAAPALQRAVLKFLSSHDMHRWMMAALSGQ